MDLGLRTLADKARATRTNNQQPGTTGKAAVVDAVDSDAQLFCKDDSLTRLLSPADNTKHDVTHSIATTGKPIRSKPRPLKPEKYMITKQESKVENGKSSTLK